MWDEKEFINPYESSGKYFWMKIESLARYYFARDEVNKINYLCPRTLDIGSANGYGSEILSKVSGEVVGLDNSEEYLTSAKEKESLKLSFFKEDLNLKIQKDYGKFDFIVAFEVIEHLDSPDNLFDFIYDSLKDNGKFICSIPNINFEYLSEDGKPTNSFHKRAYKKEEFEKLLTNHGFVVKDILGQSATNIFSKREGKFARKNRLSLNSADDAIFKEDKFIEYSASIFAYPDKINIENSYSFIFIVEKRFENK